MQNKDANTVLDESILRICIQLKKKMHALMNDYAKRYAITANEMEFIVFLGHSKLDTAKDIVNHRGYSRSLVSKTVDSLVRGGYITSSTDERDRRVVHLALTEKAREIMGDLEKTVRDIRMLAFEGISAEEILQAKDILNKILNNFQKISYETVEDNR